MPLVNLYLFQILHQFQYKNVNILRTVINVNTFVHVNDSDNGDDDDDGVQDVPRIAEIRSGVHNHAHVDYLHKYPVYLCLLGFQKKTKNELKHLNQGCNYVEARGSNCLLVI